jgi:hypothetical protein
VILSTRSDTVAMTTRIPIAKAMGVSCQSVNELLNSPEFWRNAQRAMDLWDAARAPKTTIARIKPLDAAWQPLKVVQTGRYEEFKRIPLSELPLKLRAEMLNYPTSLRIPFGIRLRAGWEYRGRGSNYSRY